VSDTGRQTKLWDIIAPPDSDDAVAAELLNIKRLIEAHCLRLAAGSLPARAEMVLLEIEQLIGVARRKTK
jgi:hypothetical protein